jgi:coproporphyrinogen III oxidase-like Fe-S oxidoreductase
MGCFRNVSVNSLHKDDDDNNNSFLHYLCVGTTATGQLHRQHRNIRKIHKYMQRIKTHKREVINYK